MVTHLLDLCDRLLDRAGDRELFNAPKQINDELARLNPRDFEQAMQAEFMIVRGRFEHLVNYHAVQLGFDPNKHESITGFKVKEALTALRNVLPYYTGEGTHLDLKPFSFLRDPELIDIIKRDYRELTLRLHPSRSWKSTVVLAGSILEAILFDVLAGPRNEARANAFAAGHPRYRNFGPIADHRWTLEALIDASANLNLIRPSDSNLVHQALRDYRNFIHPTKELRAGQALGPNEAGVAVNALNLIIDHLQATFTP